MCSMHNGLYCAICNSHHCPHISCGNLFDEFFAWLDVHSRGIKMRIDAMDWEIDRGYVKACEVIEAELRRKLQEHKDGCDRLEGHKGLLDEKVP